MRRLLPILLLACAPEADFGLGEPLPFEVSPTPGTLALRHLPLRLELPSEASPGASEVPRVHRLGAPSDAKKRPGGRLLLSYPLPFSLPESAQRFAPPGMTVVAEGVALDYDLSPNAEGHEGWKIKDGELLLVLRARRAPAVVEVTAPRHDRALDRLVFERSGLEPEDFVRYNLTLRHDTREGLLLPAPSAVEWDVTLPPGARFRAWPAIVPTPGGVRGSDDARFTLVAVSEGTEIGRWDRRVVPPGTSLWGRLLRGDGAFVPWEVDLSALGGRAVTLRVESSEGRGPGGDFTFLGAPTVTGTPKAPPRRVIVIGLDTTRPDHFGVHGYDLPTTPELDRLAETAAVFDAAWTPAPRTRPSFRAATTGRQPLEAVGAANLGEVFSARGFATAGIVANIHLNPRFDFHYGYDLWHLDAFADADEQVDRALAFLEEHPDQDAFVFLHFMDPHLNYAPPSAYRRRFVTNPDPTLPEVLGRWETASWASKGLLTDTRRDHIVGLYDGEVAFMSHEIGRLVESLDALPGQDLLVLHSDHGEEFWEHGGFEHNHTLYDEVVRGVLWVRPPEPLTAGVRLEEPVTLVDIAPTLYDYAGFTQTPVTDGRSLRALLEGRDGGGWDRPLPLGHLMYDLEQWGVVWRGYKYVVRTADGAERLFDLEADPEERDNLAPARDLSPWRDALGRAHAMPVGPGWRLALKADPGVEVVWQLPAAALAAGVIDPEATRKYRANLVWGETPEHLPEEVAEVHLSADGRELSIRAGSHGKGTVWVLFEEEVTVEGEVRSSEGVLRSYPGTDDRYWVRGPGITLTGHQGVVLDPPPGEATRIQALEAAATEDVQLLEALGYVGGGEP